MKGLFYLAKRHKITHLNSYESFCGKNSLIWYVNYIIPDWYCYVALAFGCL